MRRRLAAAAALCVVAAAAATAATAVAAQASLPDPLTGRPGDAARGRAIVADRTLGLCLLCHSGPVSEERFQGNLAPDLAGAGRRWTQAELRMRMVDPRRFNPETIMPSYRRTEGLERVSGAQRGRPILTDAQIEDVIAYLSTLHD